MRRLRPVSLPSVRSGGERPPSMPELLSKGRGDAAAGNGGNAARHVRFGRAVFRHVSHAAAFADRDRRAGRALYSGAPLEGTLERGASHTRPILHRRATGAGPIGADRICDLGLEPGPATPVNAWPNPSTNA